MKKTFALLAVLCLAFAFALPAAATTAPGELTLDLFLSDATRCQQSATVPAAAVLTGAPAAADQAVDLLFDNSPAAAGEPCGGVVCRKGTECCNASCSWCVPEGMSCIQIACN